MAFGIDDALATATAAINLAETLVETIKRYQKKEEDYDLERLLEEVRLTAIERIKEADLALTQFERTLIERKTDLNRRLADVIAATPFWKPFEQFRLNQIRKRFNDFSDSVYTAIDDVAALLRCRGKIQDMGASVVESAKVKHDLHAKLTQAGSIKEAIELLRTQLVQHRLALGG